MKWINKSNLTQIQRVCSRLVPLYWSSQGSVWICSLFVHAVLNPAIACTHLNIGRYAVPFTRTWLISRLFPDPILITYGIHRGIRQSIIWCLHVSIFSVYRQAYTCLLSGHPRGGEKFMNFFWCQVSCQTIFKDTTNIFSVYNQITDL